MKRKIIVGTLLAVCLITSPVYARSHCLDLFFEGKNQVQIIKDTKGACETNKALSTYQKIIREFVNECNVFLPLEMASENLTNLDNDVMKSGIDCLSSQK